MKNYSFFYLILLCVCCASNNKEDIEVEILNSEIVANSAIDLNHIEENILMSNNYIFDTQALNKINIKITNNSKKTYVFFLHKELDETESILNSVKSEVFYNDKTLKPNYLGYMIQTTSKHFESRKFYNELMSDSIKVLLNKNRLDEEIDIDKIQFQREMNFVVIHPGEQKYFTFYKTLPIYSEPITSYYFYKMNPDEKYYFGLNIFSSKEIVKKNLNQNQYKEIQQNRYVIFDGELQSNRVPIKFR